MKQYKYPLSYKNRWFDSDLSNISGTYDEMVAISSNYLYLDHDWNQPFTITYCLTDAMKAEVITAEMCRRLRTLAGSPDQESKNLALELFLIEEKKFHEYNQLQL